MDPRLIPNNKYVRNIYLCNIYLGIFILGIFTSVTKHGSSRFQMIFDLEGSKVSEPCSRKYNSYYDECVYETIAGLLSTHSDCNISKFFGWTRPLTSKPWVECKLSGFSKKEEEYLKAGFNG